MRCRACIRCKQYVIVQLTNPINQELIKTFEKDHRGHNLVTLELDEVKDSYENVEAKKPEESQELPV